MTHRANIAALQELGADCVLAVTVCGAVDPTLPLGSLVVFDDLHFLANRLPDGSLCSFYDQPGDPQRGHWIYEGPFSADMRAVLLEACARPASRPATAAATGTWTARASTRAPRSARSRPPA